MDLTAAERVLLHLHGFWNVPDPGRESTQAGISAGARLLRSHVPRALRSLKVEGLIDSRETRMRGHTRKITVYALTEAGVRRARQILSEVDRTAVDVDGRATNIGEARKALGMTALAALAAIDAQGHLQPTVAALDRPSLFDREEDLAFLRRWFLGAAPVAVVYGARGMGKTALGWAFAEGVPRSVWVEIAHGSDLEGFAHSVASATGVRAEAPDDPESVGESLARVFTPGPKLMVLDGYGDVPESIVDALASFLRNARRGGKVLVLAQESTPAYCRFYGKKDVDAGAVTERHLRGLGLEGCRAMLGNATIDDDALRRIYLLTKGCPLYLRAIREEDEATLRAQSRFTAAEIRLLLYSGGSAL